MLINNIWHHFIPSKIGINGITPYIVVWNSFPLNLVFPRLVQAEACCRGTGHAPGEGTAFQTARWTQTSDASHTFRIPRAAITSDHLAANPAVPETPGFAHSHL